MPNDAQTNSRGTTLSEESAQASTNPSLPKGGGSIRGVDGIFSVGAAGTGGFTIPLPVSPGRLGFSPSLSLSYDSAGGNGPFGLGWQLSVASVARKTSKGLPRYRDAEDSDTFILSGAEDLVPALVPDGPGWKRDGREATEDGALHDVRYYRPRVEGVFARIERWTRRSDGDVHWRAVGRDNVLSIYGKSAAARLADPEDGRRVFQWFLEEIREDRGQRALFEYKPEDERNVDPAVPAEKGRRVANLYLKRVKYGNAAPFTSDGWLFEVVLDYGEHDAGVPTPAEIRPWPVRQDAFSLFRATFDVRTRRLCRRVLMFHRFPELGPDPVLVRSADFTYQENPALTKLVAASMTGYIKDGAGYRKKSLPPQEFTYSEAVIDDQVRDVEAEGLENLPAGLDGRRNRWVDLDGEGLAGVLTEEGGEWFYKRNLGEGRLGPLEPVAPRPSGPLSFSRGELLDLEGDGRMSLAQLTRTPGFFGRGPAGDWEPFRAFGEAPVVSWNDPNLRFVDLDGDGRSDLLVTEDEVFRWYPSRGEGGFAAPETVPRVQDEEKGPALVLADPLQTIFLADMTGDGLADLVRIRPAEICYWPNRGHGRFGVKVSMSGAPLLDGADGFHPTRVRLADADGSGPTDLLYIGRDGRVTLYANQAGNGWSAGRAIDALPGVDDIRSITVADLLGRGTACLAWSSPLPADGRRPFRYVDLMGGVKPHLLIGLKNNFGREGRITYASSTKFYLEDKAAGTPWVSRLPFPVHVVERTEVEDKVTGALFVCRYSYHHGFYDGVEKEFRGFGRVDQEDAESFANFSRTGATNIVPADIHQPPTLSRSWYHTGALPDRPGHPDYFRPEYWKNPVWPEPALSAPILPAGLTTSEWRDALRSLKGAVLRRETYSLDGAPVAGNPHSTSDHAYEIRRLQPADGNFPAVFMALASESLSYVYDRVPADPRVTHSVVIELDDIGQTKKAATVLYGRAAPDLSLPAPLRDAQAQLHITYAEQDYTNDVVTADAHHLRMAHDARRYDVTGVAPAGRFFGRQELIDALALAPEVPFETLDGAGARKRLMTRARTLYRKNDLSGPLPAGHIESMAMVYESYTLALTPGLVTQLYGTRVTDPMLTESGHVHLGGDADWWVPSGRAVYAPDAAAHFYIARGARDPFGNESRVTHDVHDLLVVETRDALDNVVRSENDYRLLGPALVTDANGNRTTVEADELGHISKSALLGKLGGADGDTLADPTSRMEYDVDRWRLQGKPCFAHTFSREKHGAGNPRWQEGYAYYGGSGQVVMSKSQAEPGPAKRLNPDGSVSEVDTSPGVRWVGNGRTVIDNKGNVVKKYDPYFSVTPEYEDHPALTDLGVTAIVTYDALGRAVRTDLPNGTFTSIEFNPWRSRVYDPNDNVLSSRWYADRGSPAPGGAEPADPQARAAWLAAGHAGTPSETHLDVLGRAVGVVSDNGPAGKRLYRTEMDQFKTRVRLVDPAGRAVSANFLDMAGRTARAETMESGARWTFFNVIGVPFRAWHGDRVFRNTYDALHRPLAAFLKVGAAAETVLSVQVYGESHPAPEPLNARGRLLLSLDTAGAVIVDGFDFKGNILSAARRLTKNPKVPADWSGAAAAATPAAALAAAAAQLEAESFPTSFVYDALGRTTSVTLPDRSVMQPLFTEANRLKSLGVRLRGAAGATAFVTGQTHDARGKRKTLSLANGVAQTFEREPDSGRPSRGRAVRAADGAVLQDLTYVYDGVGNVVEIRDQAQREVYFNNAVAQPRTTFAHDALYQLVKAQGRERSGGGNDAQRGAGDISLHNLPHANDAAAVRLYAEEYEYDDHGNLKKMTHTAAGGSWTRRYACEAATNRLASTSVSGDPDGGPYSDAYLHDAFGRMTQMPSIASLTWNALDQLKEVDLGGGGRAYYVYGAGGHRMRKVIERLDGRREERITLGMVEIYREYAGDAKTLERETLHVTDGGGRIARVDTKTADAADATGLNDPLIRYQYGNHLGTSALETDADGNAISYEEYHPYGTSAYRSGRSAAETGLKRYRYVGKERDDETGLYYCGARYYAPWLGRWTSADPGGLIDGPNLYRYSHNNPATMSDPAGTSPSVHWVVPPNVTTTAGFADWARRAGISYTGTPTYDTTTRVWSVDSWTRGARGTGGPVTPPPTAGATAPPPATTAPPPAATGTGGTGGGTGSGTGGTGSGTGAGTGTGTAPGTGMGAGATTTAGAIEGEAPPNPAPIVGEGTIARHDLHPDALYDAAGRRISEDEHGMPRSHLSLMTDGDYGDSEYGRDTTMRWSRAAALEKTNSPVTGDNAWLRTLSTPGRSLNYREDIFERSRQEMIRAGRTAGSTVTEEQVNTLMLEQEGNLFRSIPLDEVLDHLPSAPSFSRRVGDAMRTGLGVAGSYASAFGWAAARTFIPGFVEAETGFVGVGMAMSTAFGEGGIIASPMLASAGAAMATAPAAAAATFFASGAAGYFVGDAVGSWVEEATGSRAWGVAAGTGSGALAGAGIGAAIGTFIFPGLGTAAGAIIGGVAGAIGGFIGSFW